MLALTRPCKNSNRLYIGDKTTHSSNESTSSALPLRRCELKGSEGFRTSALTYNFNPLQRGSEGFRTSPKLNTGNNTHQYHYKAINACYYSIIKF